MKYLKWMMVSAALTTLLLSRVGVNIATVTVIGDVGLYAGYNERVTLIKVDLVYYDVVIHNYSGPKYYTSKNVWCTVAERLPLPNGNARETIVFMNRNLGAVQVQVFSTESVPVNFWQTVFYGMLTDNDPGAIFNHSNSDTAVCLPVKES
jgi:hypothetical protein